MTDAGPLLRVAVDADLDAITAVMRASCWSCSRASTTSGRLRAPVCMSRTPGDHRRTAIDVAVPHPPSCVVAVVGAPKQLTAKDRSQRDERTVVHDRDIHEHLVHLDHPSLERPAAPNDRAIAIFALSGATRNPHVADTRRARAGCEARPTDQQPTSTMVG